MHEPDFLKFLEENSYTSVRQLPDGTYAGLYRLMFTTAICTGLNDIGWAYRWCFEDSALATSELEKLESMDDEPTGYVARR